MLIEPKFKRGDKVHLDWQHIPENLDTKGEDMPTFVVLRSIRHWDAYHYDIVVLWAWHIGAGEFSFDYSFEEAKVEARSESKLRFADPMQEVFSRNKTKKKNES